MPKVETMKIQLNCARCGQLFDAQGKVCGDFAQAVGEIVDMPADEAKRYLDKGLGRMPQEKKPQ
jgi:hypothetical protein